MKLKLIDAFLCKSDNKYVGFIAFTDYPFDFMRIGINSNFLYLSLILSLSVLTNLKRIKIIMEMRKNTFSDDVKKFLENSGQFISFGVLEKYHKVTDETSGLTISNLLMKKVFEHFTERKKGSFFLLGLKSNVRAIKYYEKYKGFTLPDDIGESVIVKFRVFLRIWGPPDSTITGRVKTDG